MRAAKVIRIGLIVVLLALVGGISATIGWRPFIGPKARPLTDIKFESTPARVARGEYLANTLGCLACHSERDFTQHDAPILPGRKGSGMAPFPVEELPGTVNPPNLSSDRATGAGSWTDDQLARAIREGIGNDGRALFPFMPYENYRHLPDEDLASIIVYLRTLPPVSNAVPKTQLIFPVKYLIRAVPEPLTAPVTAPDLSTPVKRGEHLVRVIGCRDCHTPAKNGQPIPGLDLGGGFPLNGPWGKVASANLTTDPSGIPYYDATLFKDVLHTGFVKARKLLQIMPWWDFRNLTNDDMDAIFAYLRTVPPVKHRVDNSKPPTLCKVCGLVHGGGDLN